MTFKTITTSGTGLMASVAALSGSEIKNGILILPESTGKGYMKHIDLGPMLKMMVTEAVFNEDILLKRTNTEQGKNEVTFSFRNVFSRGADQLLPSVQVSSSDIDLEVLIPAGTAIHTILIIIHTNLLKDLFNQKKAHVQLQHILQTNQSYLYEQLISAEIQDIAGKIIASDVPEELSDFYLKLKAQEMVYLFFVELLKREHTECYPLNLRDVKTMYLIRDQITTDLSAPPNLSLLTSTYPMSESKMNRLFKQIFGSSIYNYYQIIRMNKAAYLLKTEKLSVSETGYRLGFTNLSHFTRIFEKHMGHKPKKYSNLG